MKTRNLMGLIPALGFWDLINSNKDDYNGMDTRTGTPFPAAIPVSSPVNPDVPSVDDLGTPDGFPFAFRFPRSTLVYATLQAKKWKVSDPIGDFDYDMADINFDVFAGTNPFPVDGQSMFFPIQWQPNGVLPPLFAWLLSDILANGTGGYFPHVVYSQLNSDGTVFGFGPGDFSGNNFFLKNLSGVQIGICPLNITGGLGTGGFGDVTMLCTEEW